jgi:hypothetical protein
MPNLNAGAGAEIAETTQSRPPSSARMDQVKFEEGKRVFFRVATRDIFTVNTHRFLPVLTQPPAELVAKAKENKKEVSWPKMLWSVCQNDRIFQNAGPDGEPVPGSYEAGYGECRIERIFKGQKGRFDKPIDKVDRLTYILVVLQEAVWGDNGKLAGLKDIEEKYVSKEGTEFTVPAIRYVSQFYRSVYSAMFTAVQLDDGELAGKSFMVKREGKDYTVAPVTGAKATEKQQQAVENTLEKMGFSLAGFILAHASDDHLDRFWGDGSGTPAADANGSAAVPASPAPDAPALAEDAQDNLADFASKLSVNAKQAGSEPAAEAEPAEDGALTVSG